MACQRSSAVTAVQHGQGDNIRRLSNAYAYATSDSDTSANADTEPDSNAKSDSDANTFADAQSNCSQRPNSAR